VPVEAIKMISAINALLAGLCQDRSEKVKVVRGDHVGIDEREKSEF
jgi:hypothetical protein